MKKGFLFMTAAMVLFASSCKKEKTTTELLQSGDWTMSAMNIAGQDVYASMDACEKDNLFAFKTNNTLVQKEGATKCDPADLQESVMGNYTVNGNNVILVDGTDTTTINIVSISTSELKTTFSGGGFSATVNFTK